MALRVSTTGTNVMLDDLGIEITHPTTNRDLALEFSSQELKESADLTDAITGGDLTVDDGTFSIDATDYDPSEVVNQELNLKQDDRFISHDELNAGFKDTEIVSGVFPLSLNSTASVTKNVYAAGGKWGTWSLAPGDIVEISGSTAADGTYTVDSVSDSQNFIVVETIANSTGGTVTVYHPPASSRIAVDDNTFNNITGTTLQDVLEDIDTQLNTAVDDDKVKVSANDTTPDFLDAKLVAGTNITLVENNDGGNETLTINASGGGGATFGSDYYYNEDSSTFNTSSSSYQEATSFTTPSLEGGEYLIFWSFWIKTSNGNKAPHVRIHLDDTTVLAAYDNKTPHANEFEPKTGFCEITLTANTHDIDFDINASDPGNYTASIRDMRITLWKVTD